MKVKSIVKQFATNNIKLVFSVIITFFFNIVFSIAIPICVGLLFSRFKILDSSMDNFTTLANQTTRAALDQQNFYMILTVVILSVSVVGAVVFKYLRVHACDSFGDKLTNELKETIYGTILKSDLNEVLSHDNKELKSIIDEDCRRIGHQYFGSHLFKLLYYTLLSFISLIAAFAFDPKVGSVCIVSIPVLYFVSSAIEKHKNKVIASYDELQNKENECLDYTLENVKSIKIRNGIASEENNYRNISQNVEKNLRKVDTFTNQAISMPYIASYAIAIIIILSIAAYTYFYNDAMSYGIIVGSVATVSLFYYSLRNCIPPFLDKQHIEQTYEKLDNLLSMKLENRSESINSFEEIYGLKFSNVSYESKKKNVQDVFNVDFEVKKGERLAILGLGNCGKTTIADLCIKINRPTSGSITINNCDLMKVNTYYLRDIVTYVPQDINPLDGTIENNIIYPFKLDEYKYNEALNKCYLKELLLSLPDRDQENINHPNLTEADHQKIVLANAIYKDSPIIILDDATSKLDNQSENKIIDEFLKLKNKILIVATSKIAIANKCDKILLLSNGKVLEYGKTDELLENKRSVYYKMTKNVVNK
ncbi:MAG: ABC transporter ATP-binding protein [Bacilli bacterium]|nr:ABC transporter ATP-binding protein [Bacilli bacterium]